MEAKAYLKQLGAPGIISSMGLLFAWLAIVLLLQGAIRLSVACAIIAFILDSFDGYVARRTNTVSELGRQFDSMADFLSYSVYAALICQQLLLPNWGGVVVGYLIVLFGLLRLIRFNDEGYHESDSKKYYRGVVVCHISLVTVGFLLASTQVAIPDYVIIITLSILSVLQLSGIKTRKTGVLPFWYAVAAALMVGAVMWLP